MALSSVNESTRSLIETQIEIANKASDVNPVILFANENDYISLIFDTEYEYKGFDVFLKKIADGKIKILYVEHDAAWIRDYGPFFKTSNENVVVLDAKYYGKLGWN